MITVDDFWKGKAHCCQFCVLVGHFPGLLCPFLWLDERGGHIKRAVFFLGVMGDFLPLSACLCDFKGGPQIPYGWQSAFVWFSASRVETSKKLKYESIVWEHDTCVWCCGGSAAPLHSDDEIECIFVDEQYTMSCDVKVTRFGVFFLVWKQPILCSWSGW